MALKIKKNVPVSAGETREVWPFRNMAVGDCVEVTDRAQWERAQAYAHLLATRKGWKITTSWLKKFGRVRRVK